MSNAQEELELDELKAQIDKAAEDQKKAANETRTPSPEPEAKAPESIETPPVGTETVTPNPSESEAKADDKDPVEWAKSKGYKGPEDMARALLQKEREFHESQQKAKEVQPLPPPAWQPAPQMGYQPQYQPYPPMPRPNIRDIAAAYPQIPPEDIERLLPLVMDAARVISKQDRIEMEQKYGYIERTTQRNNELMTLMQDPAFKDERVQKEIHQILDSDPSIFQRERTPLVYAFKEAVFNMGRKQLQQGVSNGIEPVKGNMPPTTAGGGNGSANTIPKRFTEADFEKWTPKELEAYMKSNGKVIPKGR